MKGPKKEYTPIDEYISTFPKNVQATLEALRQAIKEAAPNAEEAISYQMPAFRLMVFWCILQPSKTILDSILLHRVLLSSKKNSLSMKYLKAQSDSH